MSQVWHPLTHAQQSYWDEFLHHPDSSGSVVAHRIEINGPCDTNLLLRAIRQAVDEADVLNLSFKVEESESYPRQSVTPSLGSNVEIIDLRTKSNSETLANEMMHSDSSTPINLTNSALSLQRLYLLSDEKRIWYSRAHHIAVDGYSMSLIEDRCATLYRCFVLEEIPPAAYKRLDTYIKEDHDYLTGNRFGLDEAFWQEYIENSDLEKVESNSLCSDTVEKRLELPDELGTALLTLSKKLMIGWTDVLLLLTSAYLYSHFRNKEGQKEDSLPVWIPFMNRMGNPCANTPSLMVNAIPYKVRVKQSEGAEDYLLRSVKELRKLYSHGRYRLESKNIPEGGHYFLSPFINILPFDPPEFHLCKTNHQVIAGGIADGFNITFRSSKDTSGMSVLFEGESALYDQSAVDVHANGLKDFLYTTLFNFPIN
ncbi:enterobactin synthase [Vibrio sp. vnigr-6D03]|uniref:condensation domain-containing protein n=1 Tax=Vibrio sp. vnigr-6D03 TaxID=2058088 RepID=UPI000C334C41|nr:condensation domain-containing protein [Vibrio sp. vnigr-6D03]PKF81172.1 enterobactin synthase [Vibrio sp. vnigr-6D03]